MAQYAVAQLVVAQLAVAQLLVAQLLVAQLVLTQPAVLVALIALHCHFSALYTYVAVYSSACSAVLVQ